MLNTMYFYSVTKNELGLPTQAFITKEEVNPKTGSIIKSFFHIESKVEAH